MLHLEDPGRVANGVNGEGLAKKESDVSVREFERDVSEKKGLKTLLLVNRFSDSRNEVFLQETQDVSFRKRKMEYWMRPRDSIRCRIRKVYYRVDASDVSLVVKYGYQWRKYGQKVTRDNPSSRAYFKCSFATSCPVKKKVQSVDNLTILVTTYVGVIICILASFAEPIA